MAAMTMLQKFLVLAFSLVLIGALGANFAQGAAPQTPTFTPTGLLPRQSLQLR